MCACLVQILEKKSVTNEPVCQQSLSATESRDDTDSGATGSRSVDFGAGRTFFSWENRAQDETSADVEVIGSALQTVQSEVEKDEDGDDEERHVKMVFFTVNKPGVNSIVWDPSVGADVTAQAADNAASHATVSFFSVLGMAVAALLML